MNLEQLKKKLEPFIREIVRQELEKNKKGDFDQTLKNAKKSLELLSDFGLFGTSKKKKEFDGEDLEI